jgi:NAD-dependent deacetylase
MSVATVAAALKTARRITALTGAGVSAASGIPTFRGPGGLWKTFRAETLATPAAFARDPRLVSEWYDWRRQQIVNARPNAAHDVLAAWSRSMPGFTLITQNVDGLHQQAGQTDALALHGNIAEDRWLDTPRACCQVDAIEAGHPPRCPVCGNLRRPAVVWFGENLPADALEAAEHAARHCDLMLVVGTSGEVYPAAGLAFTAHQSGARVVIVNPEPTPLDVVAELCLHESAAVCLPALLA